MSAAAKMSGSVVAGLPSPAEQYQETPLDAAEGIGERTWKMKRTKLSKRASTRWDELMTVR